MDGVDGVDLVGVGLNATDTVIPLAGFPVRGSKVGYDMWSVSLGGQVATTIVACQHWGFKTRYVGKLGDDDAARRHAAEFEQRGVEARLVQVENAGSPQSLILVDAEGERTVLCRRDERLTLLPEELRREWVVQARALHLDGYDTAAATCAARWAREAGVPVVADLDEVYSGIPELLELVDYPIVSRDFPSRLTGEADLEQALRTMHRQYGAKLTAATLGEGGVLAWDGERLHHEAAYAVPVVDTTGAGDIFHAGFLFGLLSGWPLERQMRFACAAAALNCMASGARGGIASREAIEELVATGQRREMSPELAWF